MPEPEPDPHCAVAIPRRAAVDIMMKLLAIAIVCVPAGLNGKGVGMATAVHVNAHAHAKRNAMRSDTRVTSAGVKSQSQQGRCVGASQSLVLVKTSRARNTTPEVVASTNHLNISHPPSERSPCKHIQQCTSQASNMTVTAVRVASSNGYDRSAGHSRVFLSGNIATSHHNQCMHACMCEMENWRCIPRTMMNIPPPDSHARPTQRNTHCPVFKTQPCCSRTRRC